MTDLKINKNDIELDRGESNYFLLSDKNILEISDGSECFEWEEVESRLNSACVEGHEDCLTFASTDAMYNLWNKLSSQTKHAIEDKIKEFLIQDMIVKDGFEFVIDEEDGEKEFWKDVEFPNIIDTWSKEGKCESLRVDEYKLNVDFDKITKEDIADYAYNHGGFIGSKIKFCEEHGIDISDFIAYDLTYENYTATVRFVEAKDFDTPDKMRDALNEDLQLIYDANEGKAYNFVIYDRDGEEIDMCHGTIGTEEFLSVLSEALQGQDVNVVEKLGSYRHLEECLEDNEEKLDIEIEPVKSLKDRIKRKDDFER